MVRPSFIKTNLYQVRSDPFPFSMSSFSHLGPTLYESSSRSDDVVAVESEPLLDDSEDASVKTTNTNNDNRDTTTMTSPSMAARLVFESFTNMIPNPFSWSPKIGSSSAKGAAAVLCMIPDSQTSSSIMSNASADEAFVGEVMATRAKQVKEVKRGYVPKERQLEKLMLRMQVERDQQLCASPEMSCKRCQEGTFGL